MSSSEELNYEFDLGRDERLLLANIALAIVQEHGRADEVVIPLKNALEKSGIDVLTPLNPHHISVAAFRNIGALLADRLRDEGDQRGVKRTPETRTYTVTHDYEKEQHTRVTRGNASTLRILGGASRHQF